MAGQSSAVVARTGENPFLRFVAALSTVAGWCSAAMIVAAVFITCQMIFIRFVLNGSTVWQTEAVIYLAIASTLVGLPYVQRLREAAMDVLPMASRHRHIAIDFNQGYIAQPSASGLDIAPTNEPYTTAALALMFQPDLRLSVMNFAHKKVGQKMPTVTFAGEDMLIRGHNQYNDSRQKAGVHTPRLSRIDAAGRAHFKATYAIDADAVTAAFAQLNPGSAG